MDETGDIQAIPKERHSWTSGIWLVLRMGFKNGDLKERDKEKCNIQFKIAGFKYAYTNKHNQM